MHTVFLFSAHIVRSRQWCEMMPCLDDEGCDLLVNRSGWRCTQPGGKVKTTTVSYWPFFLLLISLLLLKMIHWSQNFGHFLGILTWSWGFWEKVPDADAPLHPLWLYLSSIFSSLFIHPSIRGIKTCSWYLYRWSDWSQNRMDNGSFSEMYRCILLDWTRMWICFEVGRTFFLSSDIKFLQTKENLNGHQASIGKAFDDVIY